MFGVCSRTRMPSAFAGSVPNTITEDDMRIFERLRGRDRTESGIERRLVETIATDLLRRIDDETPVTVLSENKSTCGSCSSESEGVLAGSADLPDCASATWERVP